MLKKFLFKQMLKRAGGNLSDTEQSEALALVEKNPELFMSIANEIKARVDAGEEQMSAAMAVMQTHADELGKLRA